MGGGFTGLTAAYRLSEMGYQVEVFEASNVVGGLASGCELIGTRVEKAYHFLYKTDAYMLKMLDDLEIRDQLTYYKSSVSTYYDGKLYPMESPIDLMKFTPLKFHNRIRAGVSVLFLQKVKNWKKLTTITAMDWLTKFAGKEVTDVIWEPLLKGKFDRHYDKITMCWLWGRIKQRVDSRDSKLGGEALGYIEGGFATVVDLLLKKIDLHDGEVNTESPISAISHDPDTLKVSVTVNGQIREYDRVLLTVTCKVAERLLEPYRSKDQAYFDKLTSIDYLDAALLLFATDKPISSYYWHNINTPNSPFVVFLSLTSLIGTERFNGKHVYYIGDYIPGEHKYMSMQPDELANYWISTLGEMFESFDPESIIEHQVYRFKDAQHIVGVGFEDKIVDYQTPCDGVYLCNYSQIFPMDRGTNYAVRDGYQMADLLDSSFP